MTLSPAQRTLVKRLVSGAELQHRAPRMPSSRGDFLLKDANGETAQVITRRTVELTAAQMEKQAKALRELLEKAK